jgi:hypothetical protein
MARALALRKQEICANARDQSCDSNDADLQNKYSATACAGAANQADAPYKALEREAEAKRLALAARGIVVNNAPGCSGQASIQAHIDIWQSPFSLEKGQTGTVWIGD